MNSHHATEFAAWQRRERRRAAIRHLAHRLGIVAGGFALFAFGWLAYVGLVVMFGGCVK